MKTLKYMSAFYTEFLDMLMSNGMFNGLTLVLCFVWLCINVNWLQKEHAIIESLNKLSSFRLDLSLIIFSYNVCATGISFSFIESPNITIHQKADYHCYVDTEGVTIQWQVDGTPSTSEKVASLGIVTTGVGTSNSSLSIPGTTESSNGTIVTCIASGLVNGKLYINSSSATLYVQGQSHIAGC